jgi:hypothetical protein
VAFAHALMYEGPPFRVVDARRQQEFLGQDHAALSAGLRRR